MSCFGSHEQRDDIIRPLDPAERLFSSCHLTHVHLGVIVSCRYTVPHSVGQDAIKEKLERAVARSVLEHPILRAGVVDDNSTHPAWVRLETLDLGFHVQWHDIDEDSPDAYEKAFREVVQPQVDLPFTDLETRPPWRIIVLRPVVGNNNWIEVILSFHHVVGDGVSGRIFHETILRNLRDSADEGISDKGPSLEGKILKLPNLTERTFTTPSEKLIDYSYSPSWALETLWSELRPPFLAKKTDRGWVPAWDRTSTTTRWRMFYIDATRAARILGACRSHQTTLTGLLHALALVAFSANVPENQATEFVGDTYINLRRFIKDKPIDPEKTMMSTVMTLSHEFDSSLVKKTRQHLVQNAASTTPPSTEKQDLAMWELAADVRAQIVRKIEKGTRNVDIGLLKYIPDTRKYFEQILGKPKKTVWGVSNMGAVSNDLPGHDPTIGAKEMWEIDQCIFTQSSFKGSEGFDISVGGVKGGRIALSFIWEYGVIPDELGVTVAKDIETRLMDI